MTPYARQQFSSQMVSVSCCVNPASDPNLGEVGDGKVFCIQTFFEVMSWFASIGNTPGVPDDVTNHINGRFPALTRSDGKTKLIHEDTFVGRFKGNRTNGFILSLGINLGQ